MLDPNGFVIVIGASSGGMQALERLLHRFPPDIPAAIGIVLHLPADVDNEMFVAHLRKMTMMPCQVAYDGVPLDAGKIYLAPGGHHMLIRPTDIVLGNGPAEGRWRPSIDVSFRSAAVTWNSHCIGIILSGMLDDGTAGMEAIQRCGGHTLVLDPNEAEYPDMPMSVLKAVPVAGSLGMDALPDAVMAYMQTDPLRAKVPEDIRLENKIVERVATSMNNLPDIGDQSLYACPECGGGLWELRHGYLARYRCHIGHSFTERELIEAQGRSVENTLWVALRTMEEKRTLLTRIAEKEKEQGLKSLAKDHYARAGEMGEHIGLLKQLMYRQQRNFPAPGAASVTKKEELR